MTEFFHAVARHEFLQVALLSGLLASVSCGVIGSYVVVRRITYVAGGIAHCVLGGLGAAWFLSVNYGWRWLHPLYGAIIAALLAAVIIGLVSLRGRQREDTAISALWAVGMALGIVFIHLTRSNQIDLTSYLFGSVVMVSRGDLWLLAALDLLVVGAGVLFYNQLQAVCFDEEFARLRGLRVELYYILLLCLTALTVVLLASVVGIIMVIALLTLPVAIANYFCRTLAQLMVVAIVLSALFTTTGLALSYAPMLPPGATTILLAGSVYLLLVIVARVWRRRLPAASG